MRLRARARRRKHVCDQRNQDEHSELVQESLHRCFSSDNRPAGFNFTVAAVVSWFALRLWILFAPLREVIDVFSRKGGEVKPEGAKKNQTQTLVLPLLQNYLVAASSFFNCALTTSAVSGRYLPSR